MIRPLAVARILTSPPPDRPSTSILSSPSCAFISPAWASWAIFMISSKSGISGAPLFIQIVAGELGPRERLQRRFDQRGFEHRLLFLVSGGQLLLLERRLAAHILGPDLPGLAGDLLQRRRQVARSDRALEADDQLRRRIKDEAGVIVELLGEMAAALGLERLDHVAEGRGHGHEGALPRAGRS